MTINTIDDTTDTQTRPMTETTDLTRVAIIGAGLTGLMTAQLLEQAFLEKDRRIQIDVFEKSAGVGRLATRYKTPKTDTKKENDKQWQFDFGAQFFTAKTSMFQQYLAPWLKDGVIVPWCAQTAQISVIQDNDTPSKQSLIVLGERWGLEQPRYIASPKMTTWGREIAKKLNHTTLYYRTRVAPLAPIASIDKNNLPITETQTLLIDEQGKSLGVFDWVICTAPQAQAIELMAHSKFAQLSDIKKPTMLACYTLMLGWLTEQSLPSSILEAQWSVLETDNSQETNDEYQSTGKTSKERASIGRLFIEHHKPQRGYLLPSLTIHADNNWSQVHVDESLEDVQAKLLNAAQRLLQWDETSRPDYIDCHRWRYAATQQGQSRTAQHPLYVDQNRHWIVTGDWCLEGRIESCFEAAQATLAQVVDSITNQTTVK